MDHMSTNEDLSALVDRGVELLSEYVRTHSTDLLRQLAPIVVDLRSSFHLHSGVPDWSGRTPGYRSLMADLYTRSRIPEDELSAVQAAVRYHVGNLLRERADEDELAAVGLKPTSPKERNALTRNALQAQRDKGMQRQDVARLTTYAQALLDYVDDDAIPDQEPERLVASRIALEAAQARAGELLVRIKDAVGRPAEGRPPGRHRRTGGLAGVSV